MKLNEEILKNILFEYGTENVFTKDEIEATGSSLSEIDYSAFCKIVALRKSLNTPIYFIKNGITTGSHKSPGHLEGKAFDVRIPRASSYDVFKHSISCHIFRLGIYWNGKSFSYHLEDSPKASFWMGKKEAPGVGKWNFEGLIKNPSKD